MGGGNLNAVSGSLITYFANIASAVTTINNNAAGFGSQGTTTTGTNFAYWANVAAGTNFTGYVRRTITFSSADAARYFFNAGGQLNFVISSVTNNAGTTRGTAAATLLATNIGSISGIRNTQNGGRTGTSGTVNTSNTTAGYRTLSTVQGTMIAVTSTTAAYTGTTANVRISSQGTTGTAGDNGAVIYIDLGLGLVQSQVFDSILRIAINHRVDVVLPETTYLSDSWGGGPTIT
jgi:hypothetical protein